MANHVSLRLLVVLGLLLWLPPLAQADEISLTRTDGTVITGEIQSVDLEREEVTLSIPGAPAQTLRFADLEPESVYRIRRHVADPEAPEAHMALGTYCLEHGLAEEAETEFSEAWDLAKAQAEGALAMLRQARLAVALALRRRAQQLVNGSRLEEAWQVYTRLYEFYADAPFHEDLMPEIQRLQRTLNPPEDIPTPRALPWATPADNGNAGNGNNNGNANNGDGDADPELDRHQQSRYDAWAEGIARTQAHLHDAEEAMSLALRENQSNLARALGDRGSGVWVQLSSVRDDFQSLRGVIEPFAPDLIHEVQLGLRRTESQMIDCALHLVTYYAQNPRTGDQHLNDAIRWVNHILALDPDHQEALHWRRTFTEELLRRQN